jgi:hypothetical protein
VNFYIPLYMLLIFTCLEVVKISLDSKWLFLPHVPPTPTPLIVLIIKLPFWYLFEIFLKFWKNFIHVSETTVFLSRGNN